MNTFIVLTLVAIAGINSLLYMRLLKRHRHYIRSMSDAMGEDMKTIESLSIALRYYAAPELWRSDEPHKRSPAARDRGRVARETIKQAWPS